MAERARLRPSLRQVLFGLAAALVGGGALLRWSAPAPETRDPGGGEASLRHVRTHAVRTVAIRAETQVAGVLEPLRSVELVAETRGPVIEIGADELDRVAAGQLLVKIDPLLAEVAVESAEAALARTRSQLALARSNLERRRSLAERGVASVSDLDDAVNAEKVAAAALRESQAELKRAHDDLAKKTIRAPFAGVLRSFPVEVGEYLSEGRPIGELLDLSSVRTSIGVSDREVVSVEPGQAVRVRIEAYPGEDFAGEVLRVGAASDAASRKFPVEVGLPNPEGRLLPGMIASVTLDLGGERERLVIPREATIDEFGLRSVYVVTSDETGDGWIARRRRVSVRPIPFMPAEFEVVSGLESGDEIAVSAIRELRDGEPVRPNGSAAAGVAEEGASP